MTSFIPPPRSTLGSPSGTPDAGRRLPAAENESTVRPPSVDRFEESSSSREADGARADFDPLATESPTRRDALLDVADILLGLRQHDRDSGLDLLG